MEITNIKRFAEAYKDLRAYFNKIEPYEIRQASLFPKVTGPYMSRVKKTFNADVWDIPYNSEAFKKLYDGFIEELSDTVLKYSQQTVRVMLESYFSKSANMFTNNLDNTFANSLSDIFKNNREDLIEVIELFNEATRMIDILINGPETEEGYGITFFGPYDSFKQKALDKASAKESANKFSEDKAISTVQSSSGLATYFYNDERIMQAFLTHVNGKVGKPIAVEIKALSALGKIDTSNLSALLRSVGIDSNKKDGVIRYFRDSHQNKLLSTDEAVASAIKHYSLSTE